MTQHLTPHMTWDQISEYLIGDRSTLGHANECSSCRSEVARFESALTGFQGAVRHWSDREQVRAVWSSQIVATTIPSRGMYSGNEFKAAMTSVLVNAAIIASVLIVGTSTPVQLALNKVIPLTAPVPTPKRPLPPKPEVAEQGGGGGGPQAPAKAPTVARTFVPQPKASISNPQAALFLPYDPNALPTTATVSGTPNGITGLSGVGAGGGLGGGIGTGRGSGVGPGTDGGRGGGVFRIGGGVSAPIPTFQPEPEYSEEARKAKWAGTVRINLVVDENGQPRDIKVSRPLGLGLDEKAIEAVTKWRFKPGLKDGKPVAVEAVIEVAFHLL